MKTKTVFSLVSLLLIALSDAAWARGGGGGFGGGGHFGGSGFAGGGHPGGGGIHAAPRGFSGGRPAYFYSRGMHFAQPGTRQFLSGGRIARSSGRTTRRIANSPTRSTQASPRAPLNGRTDHISERHNAANWHNDWDRRHVHFFNHRFFVFDDGFWFGLDPGFFPWDYYPYYAYDYYPYDYYPGYYADVEPYYYDEGVYSNTPMRAPTVNAVQTQLAQQGYYNGRVDGIYGPATRDAVAKYQIAKGLDVTGSLSPDTLQSLQLPQPTAS